MVGFQHVVLVLPLFLDLSYLLVTMEHWHAHLASTHTLRVRVLPNTFSMIDPSDDLTLLAVELVQNQIAFEGAFGLQAQS